MWYTSQFACKAMSIHMHVIQQNPNHLEWIFFFWGPTCKHMFIFIWKVHWYVNHLQIRDMCNICPTHNICNKCPTFLIRICNTCPTCTICTKSATCPTCPTCPTSPISTIFPPFDDMCHMYYIEIFIICIIRTISNIFTPIPQVNEWCIHTITILMCQLLMSNVCSPSFGHLNERMHFFKGG
jgi:hypothetical protein